MIYVVKHSNVDINIPLLHYYKIIKVGKIFDDDGRDNINYLNPYINEATALYDIWKNHNDEYVGMTHYRRMFLDEMNYALRYDKAVKLLEENNQDIITTPFHTFDGDDTILSYFLYGLSVSENPNSARIFLKYYNKIIEKEPKMDLYFKNSHKFIARNMFFCRKEIIDKYCEWLFPIIIPLAEEFMNTDLENCKTQERILGHLIERMFSYWVECGGVIKKYIQTDYVTIDNKE